MPEPHHGLENGCEAVHGNQCCRAGGFSPPIELGRDAIVIGPEDLANARELVTFAQADVSRHTRRLAQLEDRRLRPRRSVAVDDQSGIVLPNDDGIERFSDQAANRADADVPGNVTFAFGIGKADLSKPPRKMLPRVIGDDEERR